MLEKDLGFQHNWFDKLNVSRETVNGKRVYVTPVGRLPSVTTALSVLNTEWLDEWKARVGEEWAREHSERAARNGDAVHKLLEKFLKNDDSWRKMMPIEISRAKPLLPILRKHVNVIYGLEYPLYSEELGVAGTADCLCSFDYINTILDFKTSSRRKLKEDIKSYFAQCTAYAIMAREIYNVEFPQIAVLLAVTDSQPILFIEKTKDWEDVTRRFFSGYKKGKFDA